MKTLFIVFATSLFFASCKPAGKIYVQPFIVADTTGKLVKAGPPAPMVWVVGDTLRMIFRKQ